MGFDIPPDQHRQIFARFLEPVEQERRPPGRPKSDRAGFMVALLIEKGWSQAAARQRIARILKKKRDVVARSHNRYLREVGQN